MNEITRAEQLQVKLDNFIFLEYHLRKNLI